MWPEWCDWELVFSGHAELRMAQRSITEIDVRAMLQQAQGYSPSPVQGRDMIEATPHGRPWIVILEPDSDDQVLVVVTAFARET